MPDPHGSNIIVDAAAADNYFLTSSMCCAPSMAAATHFVNRYCRQARSAFRRNSQTTIVVPRRTVAMERSPHLAHVITHASVPLEPLVLQS